MTPEEHLKQLRETSEAFRQWFDSKLPDIVGVEAVDFFKESFQNEGFTDEAFEPWSDVKRRTNPTRTDRAAASRKILTGATGDLGRSIEYTPAPGEVRITSDTTSVGSGKDYAAAHNEGTNTAGRNRSVTIPKRQFMGKSKTLDDKIGEITEDEAKRILKG